MKWVWMSMRPRHHVPVRGELQHSAGALGLQPQPYRLNASGRCPHIHHAVQGLAWVKDAASR